MADRKYALPDFDAVGEQFEEMSPEERAKVRAKLNEADSKQAKPAPDFNKMPAQEARKLIIEQFGFDPGWSGS